MEGAMSEAVGIVRGSFVLAIAPVFVAAHYYRELMHRKRLRQLDHFHYWPYWSMRRPERANQRTRGR
jgi:hypothetical protein